MEKTRTRLKAIDKPKPISLAKSLKRLKSSRLWKKSYIKIVVLVLLVLTGIIAFWFCLKAALKSEYPLLPIDAGSMKPTLNIGDLIVVQGLSDASEIKAAEKPAKASSIESSSYTAYKAFDGSLSTRWASAEGVDPQWIYVDLDSTATITQVKLYWEVAYASAYQIQVSNDTSS